MVDGALGRVLSAAAVFAAWSARRRSWQQQASGALACVLVRTPGALERGMVACCGVRVALHQPHACDAGLAAAAAAAAKSLPLQIAALASAALAFYPAEDPPTFLKDGQGGRCTVLSDYILCLGCIVANGTCPQTR